jgi:diacylglycerol kinase (ATP)
VIDGWATGSRRQFDVPGVVIDGTGRRFVEGTVGGVFAELLVRTERSDPHGKTSPLLWDRFGEVLDTARAEPWLIDIDGDAATVEVIGVHAMNVGYTGPGVPIAPQADPHDGLVDVVLIGRDDAAPLERYARARRAGRQQSLPTLRTLRGRTVELIPPLLHPLVVDDRVVAPAHIGLTTIDAAASAVRVLLPGRVET